MKIAVATTRPDLDGDVEHRLGLCKHLLVVDSESMAFEAIRIPGALAGPGAGTQVIALALDHGARVVLAGYVSPNIVRILSQNGVEVVTPVRGKAREAVDQYRRGQIVAKAAGRDSASIFIALKKSARQFASMLPVLLGVVMLVGLLKTLVSRDTLLAIFSGSPTSDAVVGACVGSIFAGNPVNSYVIGEALLGIGVSLFAVAAVIVSWVTVGLVQLPAEISALGMRFAIARMLMAFGMSVSIALLAALVVEAIA